MKESWPLHASRLAGEGYLWYDCSTSWSSWARILVPLRVSRPLDIKLGSTPVVNNKNKNTVDKP